MTSQIGVKTWAKGNPSPYQGRDLTHFPDWGNLIVWDAFFNNLAAGLMFVTGVIWLFGQPALNLVLPVALTAALILVLLDLLILIMDLADPPRFLHSLRVMRFTSPLSVGVWGLVSFSIFVAIAAAISWANVCTGGAAMRIVFLYALHNMAIIFALCAAVVVLCYKGVVFSCSSQPGVRDARWLPPFMIADAMLMGLSLYAIICIWVLGTYWWELFTIPMVALICARIIAFGLLWQDVKTRARLVYRHDPAVMLTILILGTAAPILLVFFGFGELILAGLLILGCGVLERYWVIGLARPARLHLPDSDMQP